MSDISLRGVSLHYQNGPRVTEVLDGVDLAVAEGEFVCLVGPSGCGKSTILSLLAGLQRPSSGSVAIGGETVTGPSPDRGVVFQEYALFPWMTIHENLVFALEQVTPRAERGRIPALAGEWLDLLGLSEFRKAFPNQLSGGMRQRVALARAFAVKPRVLLLDEPFAALDALTRLFLQDVLLELWEQHRTTVVMVTHDIDEALLLADRLIVMAPRPTRVRQTFPVYFHRPRERAALLNDEDYLLLKSQLLHLLQEGLGSELNRQAGRLELVRRAALGRESA
ncbi:MAG: ABC transporter ATP-binding protein [Methanocella sp.]